MDNEFIKEIDGDKYKITSWNKNLIGMDLVKSFMLVPIEKVKDHLGSDTGWTLYKGDEELRIKGGIFRGVEYLESIQYGVKLDNPYNNFVNPFYIFGIISRAGRCFFMNYYKAEIDAILNNKSNTVEILKAKVESSIENRDSAYKFFDSIVDSDLTNP